MKYYYFHLIFLLEIHWGTSLSLKNKGIVGFGGYEVARVRERYGDLTFVGRQERQVEWMGYWVEELKQLRQLLQAVGNSGCVPKIGTTIFSSKSRL